MFEKLVSRQSLTSAVQEQIEQAIREGKLPAGEKLPTEMELSEKFGVSRTVMREALRGLSTKGMISIEKGRGTFVKEVSASSVTDPMHMYLTMNYKSDYALDVVHARQAIEPSIAAMAATHRTGEELQLLRDNHRRLTEWKEDHQLLAKLDGEFHLLVAKASDNPIMPLVIEPIHRLMPKIKMAVYGVVKDAHASAVEYHGKIVKAIELQDAEAARDWMAEHLKQAEAHIRMSLGDGKTKPSHLN